MPSHSKPWQPVPLPCPLHRLKAPATHGAAGLNLGPLQGDGDAVEEDEGQDDIVEELVGDDGLTQDPEPGQGGQGDHVSVGLSLTLARRKAECPGTHGDQGGREEADPSLLDTSQVAISHLLRMPPSLTTLQVPNTPG